MLAAPQLIAALLWCQAPQPAPAAPTTPEPITAVPAAPGASPMGTPTSTPPATVPATAENNPQTVQEAPHPPVAAGQPPTESSTSSATAAQTETPATTERSPTQAPESAPAAPPTADTRTESEKIGAELGAGVGMEAQAPDLEALKKKKKNKPLGRYLVALEGVGLQGPTLRLRIADLDMRSVGARTSMGGFGAIARVAASERVSAEIGVKTGLVRLRDRAQGREIRHSVTLLSAGAVLFMASGKMGRLGLEGGLGAMFNRVGYQLGNRGEGTHSFASFQSHVGIAGEFQAKRLTVTISVRSYGIVTSDTAGTPKGSAFDNASKANQRPPVAKLQAYLSAALGLGYHF